MLSMIEQKQKDEKVVWDECKINIDKLCRLPRNLFGDVCESNSFFLQKNNTMRAVTLKKICFRHKRGERIGKVQVCC